jgi:hypothetical protein
MPTAFCYWPTSTGYTQAQYPWQIYTPTRPRDGSCDIVDCTPAATGGGTSPPPPPPPPPPPLPPTSTLRWFAVRNQAGQCECDQGSVPPGGTQLAPPFDTESQCLAALPLYCI